MEGFFGEIDLTLKLSPCGQEAEEKELTRWSSMNEEKAKSCVLNMNMDRCWSLPESLSVEGEKKCLIRFGDLQTMRRVRTGKRLLLEKQRRAAEASKLNNLSILSPSSCYQIHGEGEASSNINIPLRPSSDDTNLESPAKRLKHMNPYLRKGDAMNILRKMPSVTTNGDGQRGKRIEGLLYKYKGGEVSIVCLCHGTFFSPAEFVMHAGGKEVADPMKHITLSSDSFNIHGDVSGSCIA